jgi:ankyrin repeat protein
LEEEGESDEGEQNKEEGPQHEGESDSDGDSSSDDNDSAAAAHAAAIGHSPQPIVSKTAGTGNEAAADPIAETAEKSPEAALAEAAVQESVEAAPMAISPGAEGETPKPDSEVNGAVEATPEQKATSPKMDTAPRFYCPHNINERDSDENTAIHVAILSRKLEHVTLLVEAGASVHKKSDGSPPMHSAISIGSIAKHAQFAYDCVVFLSENGGDLTSKCDAMHTPLYLACMYNLPKLVEYILSTEVGGSTLNLRADRSQGRALHAAAKFDTASAVKGPTTAVAPGHPRIPQLHHHPDGSVANAQHHIPGFPGKLEAAPSVGKQAPPSVATVTSSQALVTQILLKTPGIEVDATNSVGQSPLHVACAKGNWTVVRLLLQAGANVDIADRRGFTPGQHAHKRGMLVPNDLLETLGGPPSSGIVAPPRDLIVDPDSNTLVVTHELCGLHRTCTPIRRDPNADPPPENVRRLSVLVDDETGILRTGEFGPCAWENETRRAAMVDVLKVSSHLCFGWSSR